jgi:hypothetical protein
MHFVCMKYIEGLHHYLWNELPLLEVHSINEASTKALYRETLGKKKLTNGENP